MHENTIMTFCLSDIENIQVRAAFPSQHYTLYPTTICTDIIAMSYTAVIINANALTENEYNILIDFYLDAVAGLYETIYWIGFPLPPKGLQSALKCYNSFEQFSNNMKYCFLDAQRQYKKNQDFSNRLADCLKVLSMIKQKPYIQTKELAQALEKSTRTIVRYISSLIIAGEWISYSHTTKGWYLEQGKSILFGQ